MSTVISVENLGKKYHLSHQTQRQSYVALRDVIAEKTNAIGRRLLHPFGSSNLALRFSDEEFWALNDVSFEIKQGERVGIIGRNGAGKSTLLKILSRIIEPTTGRVRIKGRVASLLEVGTGFHPELTGRENIYLNGAILGMGRAEIKKKFDEIVDFAEIEKFLDTPVKRYSSGMYVRLGFAVAAHLEPDILIVDEVLAVGDIHFQQKCFGKMKEIGTLGITVLYVSHNMGSIINLCKKGILLNAGKLGCYGESCDIINEYHKLSKIYKSAGLKSNYIADIRIVGGKTFAVGDNIKIYLKIKNIVNIKNGHIGLSFYNDQRQKIFSLTSAMCENTTAIFREKDFEGFCEVVTNKLIPGNYHVDVSVVDRGVAQLEEHERVLEFDVYNNGYYKTGREITSRDGFFVADGLWYEASKE